MQIKTKEFREVANKILPATELDKNTANLGLSVHENALYLSVTNNEIFVSVKFPFQNSTDTPAAFDAVVDASLFLTLISGLTTDTFDLSIKDNAVIVKAGKSTYKLAMIYYLDKLLELPPIVIQNKTVEMPISKDILQSILNVNSKEVQKASKIIATINDLRKYYYIDETGCFTFTDSACLNSFTLEKPVKLLLKDNVVKLFKLFNEDVSFSFGHDVTSDGILKAKVVFETENIYLAAIVNYNDEWLNKIQGPCMATKRYIAENYDHNLVLSVNSLSAAISRLMLFTKNSIEKTNMTSIPATISFNSDELTIKDKLGNMEVVNIENGSSITGTYEMVLNLADIKSILDSCKNEHITMSCGNQKSVVITRGQISNLIPEGRRD